MREILFRGKRVDNNQLVFGDLINAIDGKFIRQQDELNLEIPIISKILPDSVSQFTGVTDKNCKKIFETDLVVKIVKSGYAYDKQGVVFFDNGKFLIRTTDADIDFNLKSYWNDGQCNGYIEYELEIISNE